MEWNKKWTNHMCKIMSKRRNILSTIPSLFISNAGNIEDFREFNKVCRVAASFRATAMWKSYPHIVFNENAIYYFWDNVHLLKHYSIKLPQNWFDSSNCTNQTGIQISKFSFALDKFKNWFKAFVNCRSENVM